MDGSMNGWTDVQMDGYRHGWRHEWRQAWMDECLDGWINGTSSLYLFRSTALALSLIPLILYN